MKWVVVKGTSKAVWKKISYDICLFIWQGCYYYCYYYYFVIIKRVKHSFWKYTKLFHLVEPPLLKYLLNGICWKYASSFYKQKRFFNNNNKYYYILFLNYYYYYIPLNPEGNLLTQRKNCTPTLQGHTLKILWGVNSHFSFRNIRILILCSHIVQRLMGQKRVITSNKRLSAIELGNIKQTVARY